MNILDVILYPKKFFTRILKMNFKNLLNIDHFLNNIGLSIAESIDRSNN